MRQLFFRKFFSDTYLLYWLAAGEITSYVANPQNEVDSIDILFDFRILFTSIIHGISIEYLTLNMKISIKQE